MIRRRLLDELRDESNQPCRPSRRHQRIPGAILYVSKDLAAERPARAAHALHMTPARRAGRPSARRQEVHQCSNIFTWRPNFLLRSHLRTPPLPPWVQRRTPPGSFGPVRAGRAHRHTVFSQSPVARKGLRFLASHYPPRPFRDQTSSSREMLGTSKYPPYGLYCIVSPFREADVPRCYSHLNPHLK